MSREDQDAQVAKQGKEQILFCEQKRAEREWLVEQLRRELERQAEHIYWWDIADKGLFTQPGPPEKKFETDDSKLLDRFNLDALVRVVLDGRKKLDDNAT